MTKSVYYITGLRHRGTEALVRSLPKGEPLELRREPDNRYDANAIQVWARGQHVGYIPKSQNGALATKMDRQMAMDSAAVFTARYAFGSGGNPYAEVDE